MLSIKDFDSRTISGDIFGGLTAAVVALPLALAFGVSSGAGAIAGVYGAIIVGFFAAIFGGTSTQVSGPTGPMTVVMAAIITDFIARDPEHGLVLAFTVVMLGGFLQIIFGLLKIGKYFILVPYSVISGFMSGIGVIIILLQIPPLVGLSSVGTTIESISLLPEAASHIFDHAALLGFLTLALIYLWPRKFNHLIPAPLVALSVGTMAYLFFITPGSIDIIGPIPSGLPTLTLPHWNLEQTKDIIYSAVLLASLGSIDSLLTSLVADNLTRKHHDSDQELIGQGIGNMFAGLFGALPGAGATMRTVINIRSGGKTPVSGALHALILVVIILGAGRFAQNIPLAVLAGILVKVGIDIIDWSVFKRLKVLSLFNISLIFGVLLLTVFVDLITAVLVGSFISNLVTVDRLTDFQLNNIKIFTGADHELIDDNEKTILRQSAGAIVVLQLSGPMSFGIVRCIKQQLGEIEDNQCLIIDLSHASLMGISTAIALEEVVEDYQANNKHVILVGIHDKNRKSITSSRILQYLTPINVKESRREALTQATGLISP